MLKIFNKSQKYQDEKHIKNICENLNRNIGLIMGFNPKLKYYFNKEQQYYYIENYIQHYQISYIQLSFNIRYSKKIKTKFNSNINYKKLYTKNCLLLLEINNFYISPQGKGIGSKIFNKIVEEVSSIKTIEKIILYPKDKYSKNFWIKNGFREITIEDIDYRMDYGFKTLIFYLNHSKIKNSTHD